MDGWLLDPLVRSFARLVMGALNILWDLLSSTAFVTPDVTELPQVISFAGTSLSVVNAAYVLAFLWAGILVLGRGTVQSQAGPGELIPRLVVGLVAANFAVPLCSALIGLANALTAALTSQDITAPGSMQQLRATTISALSSLDTTTAEGVLLLLIGVLVAVLTGTLLVQWIVRTGVLIVAVGLAPLALALHGTPQTEAAAKLWWRTILGTLGVVVVQAVALHTTLRIFLDPGSNLRVLGLPTPGGEPAATMNLLVVVCLLWGIVKIPGLMRRFVTQGRPNPVGAVLRVMLVQQLTRGVTRALRGGRGGSGGRSRPGSSGGPGRISGGARPLPRPRGAGPGVTGVAYPTGRPVRLYTRDELAAGVDLYTRTVPKRAAPTVPRSTRPPLRAAGVVPQPPRPGPAPPAAPGANPASAMPRTRPVHPPVRGRWQQPGRPR